MFGTEHSPMVTQVRLLCSILSFHTSLRLPNLITREETLQPLVSYALFQGLIAFINLPIAEHESSIVLFMLLRTSGRKLFRVTMQQYASSFRNPQIQDTRANVFPVGCPNIPCLGSFLRQLHNDHRFFPNPFCALAELKVLLHEAKKITKRELSKQTPDCTGTKILITSTALRAYRNRHLGTLMRCREAWKLVEDCFDTSSFECINFQTQPNCCKSYS